MGRELTPSIEESLERIAIAVEAIEKRAWREGNARLAEFIEEENLQKMTGKVAREMYGEPETVQEQEVKEPGDQPRRDSDREVYEEAATETTGEESLPERSREIISLAREMDVEYLVHDGMVVVDATVIDEYHRRKFENRL